MIMKRNNQIILKFEIISILAVYYELLHHYIPVFNTISILFI